MSAAGRLQTMERLGIIMKFLDAEFVQGFIRMADDDINNQIFLPTRYNGVFDMLVHE